jgi:WD40 repeat protein
MNSDASRKLERKQQWKTEDILLCVARAGEPERIFAGSSDFGVYELVPQETALERYALAGETHQSYVTGLAVAGGSLVSGSYDGRLIWWDWAERRAVRAVTAHDRWIRRVIATPDGSRLISVADDMKCKIWDAGSGQLLAELSDHAEKTPHHFPSMLFAVTVSDDGRLLATGDKTGHVAIWDAASASKVGEVNAPEMYTWDPKQRVHSIGGVRSLAFSPDGKRLAVGGIGQIGNIDHLGAESRLELFQWETGERLQVMTNDKHKGLVQQIAWRPDGEQMQLVCMGGDHKGFVCLWNAADGALLQQEASDGHIHGFAANGQLSNFYLASHQRLEKWADAG